MVLVDRDHPLNVDCTGDTKVLYEDDDDNGITTHFKGDGYAILSLGNLNIRLTEEQEERIRFYYENT